MAKKPRFTLERLWVMRATGRSTGYGATPKKAAANATARDKAPQHNMARLLAAQQRMADLSSQLAHMTAQKEAWAREVVKARAMRPSDIEAECWVMMAMVVHQTISPSEALAKMRREVTVTAQEEEAAVRVAGYLKRWHVVVKRDSHAKQR